jgi:DNA-binding MarR family transcriptional regulator
MTAPGRDDAIHRVQRELLTLGRRGTARVRREDEALSTVDRSLLGYIEENPGCRAVDMAAYFQLNRSTVSRQLAALFELGYVTSSGGEATAAGRGLALNLTADGESALARASKATFDSIERRLEGWSMDDLSTLARLLERYNGTSSL